MFMNWSIQAVDGTVLHSFISNKISRSACAVRFDDWRENETLIEVLDEGRYERPIISNRD